MRWVEWERCVSPRHACRWSLGARSSNKTVNTLDLLAYTAAIFISMCCIQSAFAIDLYPIENCLWGKCTIPKKVKLYKFQPKQGRDPDAEPIGHTSKSDVTSAADKSNSPEKQNPDTVSNSEKLNSALNPEMQTEKKIIKTIDPLNPIAMSAVMQSRLDKEIMDQYDKCWKPNGSASKTYVPEIRVSYARDGSLASAPNLQNYSSNPQERKSSSAAIEAIWHCNPLKISPEFAPYYDAWKDRTLRFAPYSADSLPKSPPPSPITDDALMSRLTPEQQQQAASVWVGLQGVNLNNPAFQLNRVSTDCRIAAMRRLDLRSMMAREADLNDADALVSAGDLKEGCGKIENFIHDEDSDRVKLLECYKEADSIEASVAASKFAGLAGIASDTMRETTQKSGSKCGISMIIK